jgi:hypothetical protein
VILAYLAASGLVMGIFFKSFTLVVSCMLVALAVLVSVAKAGYRQDDSVRAVEQPDYAISVVLKVLDGVERAGRISGS